MHAILVSTWSNGVFVVADGTVRQELTGQPARGLTSDARGGALAIVGRRSLRRRSRDGTWQVIAESEADLACCAAVGDTIYVGSDDANVFRIDGSGNLDRLHGFDDVAGRERWYAGNAVIDGRVVGPPLGIRSMTATRDGAVLANVHVGGIPRSHDGGASWQPTIDIECDVHQVCAHPVRPNVVIAAAGVGLCTSLDGGITWAVEHEGLHAPFCSAVGFAGDDILVAASTDPFAEQGAVYRRPLDGRGPLQPLEGGLPRWLDGKCDTDGIAASGSVVALTDWAGNLYVSDDAGRTWSRAADGFAEPSGVLVC